ncbi:hypothetical protein GPL21_06510 [Bradyrhizobium pachyrhizi]|uniref:Uncharacterized protein n=1 Tax=Bradyrhizobium pachyrhizi TaxID=280333 RepID=A0A844SQN8_9BRAD|nr:hypothetical protein [Bradyrhizobium pachyrhizi]MVT64760.1 hypothetical protein [Bradyrhizobium pachyrhizi]WFU59174.1 hypothetical protein QA639_17380 [Bradyrhizobium pachyrhizi]
MIDIAIGRPVEAGAREYWPRRARCLVVLSFCILLSCCGAARQAVEKEAVPAPDPITETATAATEPTPAATTIPEATPVPTPTAVTVNLSGALAECRSAFPDQIAQAVARASCVIKATDLVRPLLPFPELLDRENALRKALAEQVQTRTMSLLERNIQIQKLHSQLLEEERSRLSAAPADGSKPPPLAVTQWRQSNGESCGRLGGDSGTCY